MSDDLSKRDLNRELNELQSERGLTTSAAFETEEGDYVDKDGNRIRDWSSVMFVIPPGVWKKWEADNHDLGINLTE